MGLPIKFSETSDLALSQEGTSGKGLGLILVASVCGLLVAVASLVAGAPWWAALAIYSAAGTVVALLLALRMVVCVRWPGTLTETTTVK
ncbi:MAG: hypothetical protein Q7J44_18970 [Pseudotabrizicola sp.]|uniref:hypothetical protein n=1 Tax=Pseudotabrizicola sp. TaxID=2939647 RepID=UPI00271CD715|nr:hypothetical protein [Pseudotabrizicola sp.]MDO9640622.1 hypothetical protein [Pseudotabrizicola sp.]